MEAQVCRPTQEFLGDSAAGAAGEDTSQTNALTPTSTAPEDEGASSLASTPTGRRATGAWRPQSGRETDAPTNLGCLPRDLWNPFSKPLEAWLAR
jgi:hypothetical protein